MKKLLMIGMMALAGTASAQQYGGDHHRERELELRRDQLEHKEQRIRLAQQRVDNRLDNHRRGDDMRFNGYSGRHWNRDYGMRQGECNTSNVMSSNGPIARFSGKPMNRINSGCMGAALEFAQPGQTVSWVHRNERYRVTPGHIKNYRGQTCRDVNVSIMENGRRVQMNKLACSRVNDVWNIR